ncbi:MAG: hypothetical protein ABIJ09_24370 [Pseudomonadota bacterium]
MHRTLRRASLGALVLSMSACAQMCAPDAVGTGVARLTVRNVGAMVSLLSSNSTCGFAADAVLANPTISGAVGSEGTVTWTVTGCAIDLGDDAEISKDCKGVTTDGSGKVTLSATKTVAGILTGVPTSPILPGGPDAATITITAATMDNFEVSKSNSDNKLKMIKGSLTAKAMPRLGVASDSGACAIATSIVSFSDIVLKDAEVLLTSPDLTETIPVPASNLAAQNGKKGDKENALSGSITVWDTARDVPAEGDTDGLDPDYEAQAFLDSFTCATGLATPLSFECADMTPRLADGAARLTVKMFGAVASAVAANTSCGFSSAAVGGAAVASGNPGEKGTVTFTVTGCALDFATATAVSTNCQGVETRLMGGATVSGTKTIHGFITGDPMAPVVPDSDDAAVLDLDITFDNLTVSSSADVNALLVRTGSLTGELSPRLAVASATGACEVQSGIAELMGLAWTDADVAVTSVSGTFDLPLDTSDVDALNGAWSGSTNGLSGSVSIGGTSYTVPGDAAGLDPAYNQTAFDAAWTCAPGLLTPVSHECSFKGPLATGAARLGAKVLGTVAKMIDANTSCGFSSAAVAGTPNFGTTATGDKGDAVFTVTACTMAFTAPAVIATDCTGTTTHVSGSVTVSGTKTVHGWITGNPLAPVVPDSDAPAAIDLTLTFTDFELWSSDTDASLTVASGTLAGTVGPRTALSTRGACEISSPVARMSDVTFTNADLVMRSEDKNFGFTATTSTFDAVQGSFGTQENYLAGTLTIDTVAVPVPVDGLGLNPDYDAAALAASWSCTPGLVLPVNHSSCSFNPVLAHGGARLIIKAIGTATKLLDANTTCGFSANSVLTTGVVTGSTGSTGSIAWSTAAAPCTVTIAADTAVAQDCSGTSTHVMGAFTANTAKNLAGFLTGGNPPIAPLTRTPATFTHTSLAFDAFKVYDQASGATSHASEITLTGAVQGIMKPVTGQQVGDPLGNGTPVYSISTPLAGFENITMASGTATLVSDGKTFNIDLANLALAAFNGAYNGQSNALSGSLAVEAENVTLSDPRLNPDFDQAAFDEAYVCTPGLLEVVPSN